MVVSLAGRVFSVVGWWCCGGGGGRGELDWAGGSQGPFSVDNRSSVDFSPVL